MIKAGKYTIDDQGFAISLERLGGTSREVLVLELGGGIPDDALEALCSGPIEVLDESGAVVQTHPGPFTPSPMRCGWYGPMRRVMLPP